MGENIIADKKTKAESGKRAVSVELAITAVSIALTFIFTMFVNIKLPIPAVGGLVHLGNIPLFVAAILFGKRTGAIAGGVGMAIFDMLSGWMLYAPCTLVVCGLMGFATGAIVGKECRMNKVMLGMTIALLIKIAGYYIYEAIIYHSLVVPLASIPGNVTQVVLAAIIVLIIIKPLNKAARMMLKD